MSKSQETVDKNYEAFRQVLPNIVKDHAGQFALLHSGEIVEYFDTANDAAKTGKHLFEDGEFSVQEVTNSPVNLGYFSYAQH